MTDVNGTGADPARHMYKTMSCCVKSWGTNRHAAGKLVQLVLGYAWLRPGGLPAKGGMMRHGRGPSIAEWYTELCALVNVGQKISKVVCEVADRTWSHGDSW